VGTETETELKLIPRLLHVFELSELVDPGGVMLGTTELIGFGSVI
jgi:hypothetical protein